MNDLAKRIIATVALLALVTGCTRVGTTGEGQTRHSSTHPHELRYGDLGDPSTLNPMLTSDLVSSWLYEMTMAYLVRYDAKNTPIPELATEVPSIANGGIGRDGRTITYHLRHNVKWSDGAPFDADDVIFSTRLVLDPKTNVISRDGWDRITTIGEPDKFTVVYHLRAPYSSVIGTFFATGSSGPSILPKHLLAHTTDINRDPYNQLPVGIGPFKFKRWARGDRVELAANPNYWR
ncbi:MAG: ABC transporter substrate-binding protein, partial [Candidatus Eremiobacteraeota bacterium]|nr:ABC transporter substrate-binding protein [Candidatus Eremiobacteraeota bacterium]